MQGLPWGWVGAHQLRWGGKLLAEGMALPRPGLSWFCSLLGVDRTPPGPRALSELMSRDYDKKQSLKVGERSWQSGSTPDFGLCPLPAGKAQNTEITVFPPLPQACPGVTGPQSCLSCLSPNQHLGVVWELLLTISASFEGGDRATERSGLSLGALVVGRASSSEQTQKCLETELVGLMDGDLAAGKVSPATGEGGFMPGTLPKLSELAGTSHPIAQMGRLRPRGSMQ